ncbi:flagellar protein FlhE [Franzmannia pantelleriensis]|nr:flagellar protein FlhE [Halomonas pantelleriensis]
MTWLLLLATGSPALAEPPGVSGSWIAQAESVRVAVPGRDRYSQALGAAAPAGAQVASVSWQYTTPPGAQVTAWLCHPQRCQQLAGHRGRSEALAGLSATEPLHFRFRLGQGARPVQVSGLQVIVDHRQVADPKAQKTVGQ